jgi:hypothetical protein
MGFYNKIGLDLDGKPKLQKKSKNPKNPNPKKSINPINPWNPKSKPKKNPKIQNLNPNPKSDFFFGYLYSKFS